MKKQQIGQSLIRFITVLILLFQLIQIIFIKEDNMTGEQIELLIKIGFGLAGIIFGAIPAIIGWIKAKNAKKSAKTEEEKRSAENDMHEYMKTLISSAEKVFEQVDVVLKRNGDSAGPLKKDSVMSKLISYAVSKNYSFDEAYWSEEIDKEVSFTREVNKK